MDLIRFLEELGATVQKVEALMLLFPYAVKPKNSEKS